MPSFLFVGAPFGPFFRELVEAIELRGSRAFRAVTQGGEFLETPGRCRVLFRGDIGEWPAFVNRAIVEREIDTIVTFNDTLPLNRIALDVAKRLNLHSFVLENGYLRPYWVTLERDGVNGFSRLPRDKKVYLDAAYKDAAPTPHDVFRGGLRPHTINALRHFAAAVALSPVFGLDTRYYGDSIWRQGRGYVKEALWRWTHDEAEKMARISDLVAGGKRIFLCLLQKPGDGQLSVHSRHGGNVDFLEEVIKSFAASAPADAILVVKQHPLDYGVEKCPKRGEAAAKRLGISDRMVYLRKTSIDKIMPMARGVVTINSTAGLAAIIEGKPVICLGRAFYDITGLTCQNPLSEFWRQPVPPPAELVAGFLSFLKATSQVNGGFHTPEGRALLAPRLAARLVEGVARFPAERKGALVLASYAERHAAPSSLLELSPRRI